MMVNPIHKSFIFCVFFAVHEGALVKTQPMERLSVHLSARGVWQNSGRCSALFWSASWLRLEHGTLEEFSGTTTLSNSIGFTMSHHPPLGFCLWQYYWLHPRLRASESIPKAWSTTSLEMQFQWHRHSGRCGSSWSILKSSTAGKNWCTFSVFPLNIACKILQSPLAWTEHKTGCVLIYRPWIAKVEIWLPIYSCLMLFADYTHYTAYWMLVYIVYNRTRAVWTGRNNVHQNISKYQILILKRLTVRYLLCSLYL